MKKKSLVVYAILLIFLVFVAVKANVSAQKTDSLGMPIENDAPKMQWNIFKNMFNSGNIKEKHYEKDISTNVIANNTYKHKKTESEEFSVYPSVEDNTVVYKKMYKIYSDKKCALVNEEGVKVSKSVYDDFVDFDRKNGIYKSKLNGKTGLMNYNGKILIPAKFETIEYNPNSHFCIVKNHSYKGLYDIKKARAIAGTIYNDIIPFDSNNWKIIASKKVGVVHYRKGKLVLIKPKYTNIVVTDGYLKTFNGNKFGIINLESGDVVSEPKYDGVDLINVGDAFTKGTYIFKIKLEDRYGLIFYSQNSSLVIPPIYTQVVYFENDKLVKVVSNGNVQYLDEKGNIVTDKKKIGYE